MPARRYGLQDSWRFSLVFLVLVGAGLPTDRETQAAAAEREAVYFSFDDESIPWRDNLKLTLERPKKYAGNPVMRAGPPGSPDGNGCLLYGTVLKEGGKFRMWYIAWPQPDPRYPQQGKRLHRPVAYAESVDGIHWDKPNLGLVEFRGSKDNNLVSIQPASDTFAVPDDYVSVLRDESETDPARRYKMVYISYVPELRHSTGVTAVSADGLRWKLAGARDFSKGHFENTSLVKFHGLYYVTGQNLGRAGGHLPDGSDAGRAMTCFFSPDFQHWSSGRALSFVHSNYEPKPEGFGQELHMGAGLWNRGNVLVGLYGRWHGDKISSDPAKRKITSIYGLEIDLGLVLSNDAIHYREPVQNFVMVSPGEADAWDALGLLQAQAFQNTDSETYIWYSSWHTSNPFPSPSLPAARSPQPPQVGLLSMRRDGFGYLSKQLIELPKKPGFQRTDTLASVLTKNIKLERGGRLLVNVAGASAEAPLQVALVDDAEQPLSGTAITTVKTSGVRVPVELGEHGLPAGKKFRIRIQWPAGDANPRFYAMYIATPSP
ncbi:MAG TPA: hypothetical protein VIK18_07000 [Pirellulales bacterium]